MDIVWLGFAFLFGLLLTRIHVPSLVGYLLAGLGLSLTSYQPGALLNEIAHLGVIFLLFTVGLHISIRNVIQKEVLGVGLIHLLISSLIFTPVGIYFGLRLEAAVIVAVTLGFSSTVLAAKNLESRNDLGAYYGRLSIGILIVQDLVAIGIIAYAGGGTPSPWALVLLGLPLLRPLLSWLLSILIRDELLLLMSLSLAVGGATMFEWFNLSGELGALVIGMLFVNDERADQLEKKLWGIKEAFLVGFFLEIGLGGFPSADGYYFIGVMLLLLPLKTVLFFALFMLFRLRARTGFLSTITLTAYSEFTLIAGTVAVSAGILPPEMIIILGMLVAISYGLNSIIVRYEDKIWEMTHGFLSRFEQDVKHPDHQSYSVGSARYLVIGLGATGIAAFSYLKQKGMPVVGMDIDQDHVRKLVSQGYRAISADAMDSDLWEEIEISKLDHILIAMSGDIQLKLYIIQQIRKNNFSGNILVLTQNVREDDLIRDAGAEPVAVPSIQMGEKMAELSMEAD